MSGLTLRALAQLRSLPSDEVARRLPVYPADVLGKGGEARPPAFLQPVAGRYVVEGEAVCFVPRFPFLDGHAYTVLVHRSLTENGALAGFDLDSFDALTLCRPDTRGAPTTWVVEIYPTAAVIPRNLLRVYVQFSAPMSEGFATSRVRVVDAVDGRGETVDDVLLPMDPELWDPERRRLTVLFDPARIKRGLRPHREVGYPLRELESVEVVVDRDFVDAVGRPLVATHTRRYEVGPDVRELVDPTGWHISRPAAGTRNPFVVEFDRPLDHGLLQHCLVVVDAEGVEVRGFGCSRPGERAWVFTPEVPWGDEAKRLRVDPALEDVAGNSVRRVFDRDLRTSELMTRRANTFGSWRT